MSDCNPVQVRPLPGRGCRDRSSTTSFYAILRGFAEAFSFGLRQRPALPGVSVRALLPPPAARGRKPNQVQCCTLGGHSTEKSNRSIIPRYRKIVVPGTHTAENHDFISSDQGSRSSISKFLLCNRSIIPRYRKSWFPALTLPRTTTSFLLTRGADHQSRSSCSVLRAQAIG